MTPADQVRAFVKAHSRTHENDLVARAEPVGLDQANVITREVLLALLKANEDAQVRINELLHVATQEVFKRRYASRAALLLAQGDTFKLEAAYAQALVDYDQPVITGIDLQEGGL